MGVTEYVRRPDGTTLHRCDACEAFVDVPGRFRHADCPPPVSPARIAARAKVSERGA